MRWRHAESVMKALCRLRVSFAQGQEKQSGGETCCAPEEAGVITRTRKSRSDNSPAIRKFEEHEEYQKIIVFVSKRKRC